MGQEARPSVFNLIGCIFAFVFVAAVVLFGHPPRSAGACGDSDGQARRYRAANFRSEITCRIVPGTARHGNHIVDADDDPTRRTGQEVK
jgi:hypothetical protein